MIKILKKIVTWILILSILFVIVPVKNIESDPTNGIIIYNPYEEVNFITAHHYKANLHTHTTQSDGGSSPSTVINHYCKIGNYDILEITDHDTNTWPWSKWITGYIPEYESESSAYYPTLGGGVLAISGNEPSDSSDPPYGHDHNSCLNDYAGNAIYPDDSLQYIQNHNGLSFFFHPGRYHYSIDWYSNYFDTYNILLGVEAFNQGDRYPNDRETWDSINKQRDPDDLIWGFSDDDMHDISTQAFRNYQHFLMNDLTETEFRNAMINGAFYFSYEPNGANSESSTYGQADTPKLTNVVINNDIITISGEDYTSIQWYDQTTSIVGTGTSIKLSSLSYTKFVRAVLTNAYGVTYTQPFGFEINNPQEDYYTLTTTIIGNGVVTPASGSSYLAGTIVTVKATPNAGWQFIDWGGDLNGNTNPKSITMNKNKNIIADFTQILENNNPPIATPDSYTTYEDIILSVTAPGLLDNDYDTEDDILTAMKTSNPTQGLVILNNNGSFRYIPNTNYFGIDTFTYKIYDGYNYSKVVNITITINPVNDPPVLGTPSPKNASTGNQLSLTWSIPINDPEGDLFSWTIQCINGQTNSENTASNGTKSLTISGLSYSTIYKVWVNATNQNDRAITTQHWYTFTTKTKGGSGSSSGSGGSIGDLIPPTTPTNVKCTTSRNDNTPSFNWTKSTDTSGISGYYVKIDIGIDTLIGNLVNWTSPNIIADGIHTFYVKAKDTKGNIGSYGSCSFTINTTVIPKPPTADINGPYTGLTKENIIFDGSKSIDIDGTIIGYRWDWTNDGTYDTDWLTTKTTTHAYLISGKYIVKLQVKDNTNTTATDTATVYIIEDTDDDDDGLSDDIEIQLGSNPNNQTDVTDIDINGTKYFLVDINQDGQIDTFYNPNINISTAMQLEHGKYKVDMDGDGKTDHLYNPASGETSTYKPYEDFSVLFIGILVIIIVLIIIIADLFKSKHLYVEKNLKKKNQPRTKKRKRKNNPKIRKVINQKPKKTKKK